MSRFLSLTVCLPIHGRENTMESDITHGRFLIPRAECSGWQLDVFINPWLLDVSSAHISRCNARGQTCFQPTGSVPVAERRKTQRFSVCDDDKSFSFTNHFFQTNKFNPEPSSVEKLPEPRLAKLHHILIGTLTVYHTITI